MKLKEYQGKEIFRKYGINVPEGYVVSKPEEVKDDKAVLKAQVLEGSRKKKGLIIVSDNAKQDVEKLLGKCSEVLVEEMIQIEKESYLSFTIDRFEKCVKMLYAEEGGIDIEENPDKVKKLKVENVEDITLQGSLKNVATKLFKIMKDYDAELVEINPLAFTKEGLVAVDSKIIIDDNSLFRHLDLVENKVCLAEDRASMCGFNYVELDGNIAVIGNGAGLVMSTLDVINYYGGKPADFLDIGGGASSERMEEAMRLVLSRNPKVLLINIFGGITRCDEIAKAIVNYKKNNSINIPIIVRMIGTNQKQAQKLLNENCIVALESMEDCVKAAVEVVKND
ncbi:ADP-forming succinate--CoA ligase subunit beta [Candidatus Woesearchaeota archaeon]|nr:MAG: ADP-forming succinate--CoA ligase subunit beta [Candidatus Woesearchaeota archaeon]